MLRDFNPLEFNYVELEQGDLKDFGKQILTELFEEKIEFKNHVLSVPAFDESGLSTLLFDGSNQKRMLPFGFRLIDSTINYSPLGTAAAIVYGSVLTRKDSDFRHPNESMIFKKEMQFVFNQETQKWYQVDLKNENHECTVLYHQIKAEELELNNHYKDIYFRYFDAFKTFLGIPYSFTTKSNVKRYLDGFVVYFGDFREGLESYRFFDKITPLEMTYLIKYAKVLVEHLERVYPYLSLIENDDSNNMTFDEKKIFNELLDVAGYIRNFFTPRNEKNPFANDIQGYCPTKVFLKKLKDKRVLIPNISEVERRMAYSSEKVFNNEKQEQKTIEKIIDELYGSEKQEKTEDKIIEKVPGLLGEKYNVSIEFYNKFKTRTKEEKKHMLLRYAKDNNFSASEALNDVQKVLKLQ